MGQNVCLRLSARCSDVELGKLAQPVTMLKRGDYGGGFQHTLSIRELEQTLTATALYIS